MAASPALEKVIEKHLQEFGFLWGQRQTALRSPDYKLSDVEVLDGRIAAHFDGLLLAANAAPELFAAKLEGDDAWTIFTAGLVLLRLRTPEAAAAVVRKLLIAEPVQAEALGQALLHGPIDPIETQLRDAVDSAAPHVAAAALESLMYHGCNNLEPRRLAELVRHESPAVRCGAWRIVALGGAAS